MMVRKRDWIVMLAALGGVAALAGSRNASMLEGLQAETMQAAEDEYETIPVIDAYYEGEKMWFIHTDVSDEKMAQMLTMMVGYRTIHVPRLGEISEEKVGKFYVFTNGIDQKDAKPWGGGPLGYQIDIFESVPGDEGYMPLRSPQLVTWKETATPRILKSLEELRQAEESGELTIRPSGVIVNVPVVRWPTDYLGGGSHLDEMEKMNIKKMKMNNMDM